MPIVPIQCSMRKGANFWFRIRTKLSNYFYRPINSTFEIPIIINNFNRLSYLKMQIEWLENAGYRNIYIIDNYSDYPPLLDYYEKTLYTVFKLDRNQGHFSLWETVIFMKFSKDFYVYTDSDVLPIHDCPKDILNYFKNLLIEFPKFQKVGFGLKIDDIPDHYNLKKRVVKWENQFWKNTLKTDIFEALIDTTFALYRPGEKGGADLFAIRTGGKYLARHLPWYENSDFIDSETEYYMKTCNSSSSWYSAVKGEKTIY